MSGLFAILFLTSLALLIIGLIKPSLFKRIFQNKSGRKFESLVFGSLVILFFILTALTAPQNTKPNTTAQTSHDQPTYQPLDAWYSDPGWVGYVNTSGTYKSISAIWTVPTVRQSAPDTSPSKDELMSTWIGIGGFNSTNLVQIGTNQSIVDVGGATPAYFAFWERYPTDPSTVQIKTLTISPGDKISASIVQQSDGRWLIELSNLTNGQKFSKVVSFSADQTTAEWVLENEPTNSTISGPRTLPNFGSIKFSSLSVNGQTPKGLRKIKMVRNGRTIIEPSKLTSDDSFTISNR